jgi:hypothetical protein
MWFPLEEPHQQKQPFAQPRAQQRQGERTGLTNRRAHQSPHSQKKPTVHTSAYKFQKKRPCARFEPFPELDCGMFDFFTGKTDVRMFDPCPSYPQGKLKKVASGY